MTLKDQIAADCAAGGVFLNTSDFAQSVAFWPKGGVMRTLVCVVDFSESFPEQQTGMAQHEAIDVFVSKDADGITDPQIGDAIVLDGEARDKAWAYQETIEGDEHAHTLRFVRSRMYQVGGGRQTR